MADVNFDLRSSSAYIRSFADLSAALVPRTKERIIEVLVLFPSCKITLYMEAQSLYIAGFQNDRGEVIALDGGGEKFDRYLQKSYPAKTVIQSNIGARYGGEETWKLTIVRSMLDQACILNTFVRDDRRASIAKPHIDRMAFCIAEAARFMPIRCGVACLLHDDYRFLAVLQRLGNYAKGLIMQERTAPKVEPDVKLSPRDAQIRSVHPTGNVKVFEMKGNMFDGLSKTERWFKLLTSAGKDLSETDRARLRSLPTDTWCDFTLGDFRDLVKNWSKLSAATDPYIPEILQEVHIRNAASSTPEDGTRFMTEWH